MDESIQESSSKTPNKSGPRVIAREPDRSLSRYMIDEFKAKASGSKQVPFEAIDLNLYKPKAKLVGFQTTESRLSIWIEAIIARYVDCIGKQQDICVTWEELESYSHPGKPDKIHLVVKKDDEKMFVISVFVTTGRIQVQGYYYSEWSSTEFPLLMSMIEKLSQSEEPPPESQEDLFYNQSNDSDDDDSEIETDCEQTDSSDSSEDEEEIDTSNNHKVVNEDHKEPETEITDLSVKFLATTISKIESDFIASKASLESELFNIKQSLDEVSFVKDRIVHFENQTKAHLVGFDDRLFHNETETNKINVKLTELSNQIKSLTEQKKQLLSNQGQMKTEIETLKKENDTLKKELFVIKEIVQKHENALDSHQEQQPEMTSQQESESNPPRDEQRIPSSTNMPQPVNDSVLLVIDSNGKHVQPKLLCPDERLDHKTSYTLKHAMDNINGTTYKPKTIIIHCGTNDLEKSSPEHIIKESQALLETTQKKFSQAKIIYSNLLPRQDPLQQDISTVNNAMEQYCKRYNIQYLNNSHISKPYQFYDFKHLNQRGFKFFAKNLKSAIYGTVTRQSRANQTSTNPNNSFSRRPSPEFWPRRSIASIPQATQDFHLQNNVPSYASVTASPVNYPSRPIRPKPDSFLNPAQPMNSGILNSSGLPVPLKSLIQQLQLFI